MGPSECVRTLGWPVHPATWPGGGVGSSEPVCLLWQPELVFVVRMEVRLLVLVHCLLRLAASGLPRLGGCFGRRLLQRMVAAFSTFLLVCVVFVVLCELVVRFRVELLPGLESLSQSSISAMVGLVVVLKSFAGIETVLGCT